MEEWKEYKLGEVCTISSSKRIFANEYQNTGEQESRRLAELRDTLLPKLMSGELKVNEIA